MSLKTLPQITERTTAAFQCTFRDINLEERAPKEIRYSLVNQHGIPINFVERKQHTPVNATVYIVLNPEDSQVLESEEGFEKVFRRFIIEGIYDSAIGQDHTVNKWFDFEILNSKFIKNVTS